MIAYTVAYLLFWLYPRMATLSHPLFGVIETIQSFSARSAPSRIKETYDISQCLVLARTNCYPRSASQCCEPIYRFLHHSLI